MKKGLKRCKWLVVTKQQVKQCKLFFRKILSVFFYPQLLSEQGASLKVLVELHYEKLDEYARSSLTNHIQLLQLIGYRVIVKPKQEKTTNEAIGYLSYYRAGKLEFQEELQMQSVKIEKKRVVSRRTP